MFTLVTTGLLIEDLKRPLLFYRLLTRPNWNSWLVKGGIVLGERSAWGRGIATAAVRVRTRFAFQTLGLHRIEGHTVNPAMHRVYEKAGYTHEGTIREALWRDGRWVDAESFAILDRDYFASRT